MKSLDKAEAVCREFPNASTRAVARILQKRFPKTFLNYTTARTTVMKARGNDASRKCSQRVPGTKHSSAGLKLPESHAGTYENFLVDGPVRCAVLSDIHLPYHDKAALEAAIVTARRWNADCFLLNGDLLDCCSVSTHERDPDARDLAHELRVGREFLQFLRSKFKDARMVYRSGNHEDRLRKYVARNAPELLGVDEILLERLLKLQDVGVEWVTGKRIVNLGKLPTLHGHEFYSGQNSPVNAARGLFMRGKASAVQGHLHQTSEHTETALDGKTLTTWSLGCLCNLNPSYSPLASLRWNHGMAVIEIAADGNFEVNNLRLINGRYI
jgi:predicted phosphodiesterase